MYVLRAGLGATDSVDLSTLYPAGFPGGIVDAAPAVCADGSPVPASGVCAGGASPVSGGITSFLNNNAGKITIAAAAFVGLMIFSKRGR